jgi:mono/diheme cytochrome c family protein
VPATSASGRPFDKPAPAYYSGTARRRITIDALYQLLSKIGFKDPLHAPLTHFPVALAVGAFLFFLVAILFRRKSLVFTARHVSILAFLFAFPTILFGVFDWLRFFKGAWIFEIKIKMILAGAVLVILAVGIILGRKLPVRTAPMLIAYALAAVAVIGLGYYGARLVYGGWTSGASVAVAEGAAGGQAGAKPASQAALKAGGDLFAANCQRCHPNGDNVMMAQLPLKTSKRLSSGKSFMAFLRAPGLPDGTKGLMPAFPPKQLSDQQAGELYAYIMAMRSRWR